MTNVTKYEPVRISPEIKANLKDFARKEGRVMQWVVDRAVESYLEKQNHESIQRNQLSTGSTLHPAG